jgi:hypothetical protein
MTAREIDELFAQALSGDYEDDAPWEAVRALRSIGIRQIFERATDLCKSTDPLSRARGADVLGQLGKTADHSSNTFPEESYSLITELVQRETEPPTPRCRYRCAGAPRQPACCSTNHQLLFAS